MSPKTEKQSERDANQSPAVVLRERGGKTAGWTRKQCRGQRSTAEHDKGPLIGQFGEVRLLPAPHSGLHLAARC